MKIKVEKQKRKTIVLKMIDSENAVLKVPNFCSKKQIDEFLESKKKWLEKSSQKIKENENFAKGFSFDKFVYLNGKPVDSVENIVLGFGKLTDKGKKSAVKKYYLSMFWKLRELAQKCALSSGLGYDEIKPVSSVKVWGSYNSKREMKLNWKLVILPEELAYYVVCHELAHSVHFNHKPQFWKEVEKMCPNYKVLRKQLNGYGFLLKSDVI